MKTRPLSPCRRRLILLFLALPFLIAAGWDMNRHAIPLDQIMASSVPREGIPALNAPAFVAGKGVRFVRSDEPVLGVDLNGVAKAYPLRILSWHEVVNDRFGDQPVLVSWCPLAYAGAVFSRKIEGQERSFGVSGLLHRSNLLMYDRATESLWSQIRGDAVTGKLTGTRLERLPSRLTTWGKWRKQHPATLVLSTDTGYPRDYTVDPYLEYYARDKGYWSFFDPGPGEKEKELVIGIELDGQSRAWPLATVRSGKELRDTLGKTPLRISYDAPTDQLWVLGGDGQPLSHQICYWFVWKGIYPQTSRYAPH